MQAPLLRHQIRRSLLLMGIIILEILTIIKINQQMILKTLEIGEVGPNQVMPPVIIQVKEVSRTLVVFHSITVVPEQHLLPHLVNLIIHTICLTSALLQMQHQILQIQIKYSIIFHNQIMLPHHLLTTILIKKSNQ